MFSSTAYEAIYTYIGLYLHEASVKIITSQEVFLAILVIIVGSLFLFTAWRFFSNYIPGTLGGRRGGKSLGVFFKILVCFFLGVGLLKLGSYTKIRSFKKVSWHTNPYIESKFPGLEESYRVSFIFDILSRSSEEVARYLGVIVDKLFQSTNSELETPSIFYRAIMYAGTGTIDDPTLRDKIDFYTHECFEKVLPLIEAGKKKDKVDEFFSENGAVDRELNLILIELESGKKLTCLDLKNEVRRSFEIYSMEKTRALGALESFMGPRPIFEDRTLRNLSASGALVNYFLNKKEDVLGIHEGAKVPGTAARIFQYFDRITSWDGLLSLFGGKKYIGAALTAQRAQKFSEYLHRVPHIKGMGKMILIFIFPWLVFIVAAGRWKVLIYWTAIYFSVLMWTPLWTLFYHIMTNIALSTEVLEAFGSLSDGISLYSAELITSKLYHFYAVYSWLQLIVGPLPTIILAYGLFNSLLRDSEVETAPQIVTETKNVGKAVITKAL